MELRILREQQIELLDHFDRWFFYLSGTMCCWIVSGVDLFTFYPSFFIPNNVLIQEDSNTNMTWVFSQQHCWETVCNTGLPCVTGNLAVRVQGESQGFSCLYLGISRHPLFYPECPKSWISDEGFVGSSSVAKPLLMLMLLRLSLALQTVVYVPYRWIESLYLTSDRC